MGTSQRGGPASARRAQLPGPRRASKRAPEASRPVARHILVLAGGGRAAVDHAAHGRAIMSTKAALRVVGVFRFRVPVARRKLSRPILLALAVLGREPIRTPQRPVVKDTDGAPKARDRHVGVPPRTRIGRTVEEERAVPQSLDRCSACATAPRMRAFKSSLAGACGAGADRILFLPFFGPRRSNAWRCAQCSRRRRSGRR